MCYTREMKAFIGDERSLFIFSRGQFKALWCATTIIIPYLALASYEYIFGPVFLKLKKQFWSFMAQNNVLYSISFHTAKAKVAEIQICLSSVLSWT